MGGDMHIEFTMNDGNTIALRSDQQNFELARQRVRTDKATGTTAADWEGFSYHATLEHALTKLLTLKVRSSKATDLQSLKTDIEQARKDIVAGWGNPVDSFLAGKQCRCHESKTKHSHPDKD